ncbi:MAG: hypothetical protein ACJAVE_001421 [Polaribacter sp.]|jgi:hypothetical protein
MGIFQFLKGVLIIFILKKKIWCIKNEEQQSKELILS